MKKNEKENNTRGKPEMYYMEDVYYVYTKPINLKAYGELNDGKVTFRYEGSVTTQEGEINDYFKEATFDFGVIPKMKGF